MVGAVARYLMLEVWQGGKIGVRRAAVIIGRKSPVFVNFRQPDTKNFDVGFQGLYGKQSTPDKGPSDSCSGKWDSSHPGDMHGRVKIHA